MEDIKFLGRLLGFLGRVFLKIVGTVILMLLGLYLISSASIPGVLLGAWLMFLALGVRPLGREESR